MAELNDQSILCETTRPANEAGISAGDNLASGTVREMIAAALTLPEHRFERCFISVLPHGTLRPDAILDLAEANDIEASGLEL